MTEEDQKTEIKRSIAVVVFFLVGLLIFALGFSFNHPQRQDTYLRIEKDGRVYELRFRGEEIVDWKKL